MTATDTRWVGRVPLGAVYPSIQRLAATSMKRLDDAAYRAALRCPPVPRDGFATIDRYYRLLLAIEVARIPLPKV